MRKLVALVTITVIGTVPAMAQQQQPDPTAVQAALRMELGKAQFEAGQFQAQLIQAQAALKQAQDKIAELQKTAGETKGNQ